MQINNYCCPTKTENVQKKDLQPIDFKQALRAGSKTSPFNESSLTITVQSITARCAHTSKRFV